METARHAYGFSATRAARIVGLTYRQVDYYARRGIVRPNVDGAGSGTRRFYSPADLDRLKLAAALRKLGALTDVIGHVLEQLPDDSAAWPEFMFISPAGEVGHNRPAGAACWMITTQRLLRGAPSLANAAA